MIDVIGHNRLEIYQTGGNTEQGAFKAGNKAGEILEALTLEWRVVREHRSLIGEAARQLDGQVGPGILVTLCEIGGVISGSVRPKAVVGPLERDLLVRPGACENRQGRVPGLEVKEVNGEGEPA
jgi:hypothetical protein